MYYPVKYKPYKQISTGFFAWLAAKEFASEMTVWGMWGWFLQIFYIGKWRRECLWPHNGEIDAFENGIVFNSMFIAFSLTVKTRLYLGTFNRSLKLVRT